MQCFCWGRNSVFPDWSAELQLLTWLLTISRSQSFTVLGVEWDLSTDGKKTWLKYEPSKSGKQSLNMIFNIMYCNIQNIYWNNTKKEDKL